jgi:hypothetical protein
LLLDPLEERQMLSVSASTAYDIPIAENILGTEYMVEGQSIAVDDSGDIVAVWQRTDTAGDTNIYARYLTDQMERITLPQEIFEQGAGAQVKFRLYLPRESTDVSASTELKTTPSASDWQNPLLWESIDINPITLGAADATDYNCEALTDGLAVQRGYDAAPIDFTTPANAGRPYTTTVASTEAKVAVTVTARTTYSETTGQTTVVPGSYDITYTGALAKRDLSRTGSDGRPMACLVVEWVKDARGQNWTLSGGVPGTVELLKVSSPEFRVNAPEEPDPVTGELKLQNQSQAAVAVDADGDFVITWESTVSESDTAGSVKDIYARRFSPEAYIANPSSLGAEDQPLQSTDLYSSVVLSTRTDKDTAVFTLSQTSYLSVGDKVDVYWPSTLTESNGLRQQMVVTAKSTTAGGTTVTLDGGYGADLPSAGTALKLLGYKWVDGVRALGNEFRVNTFTANAQSQAHVAMNDAGDFVVVWATAAQDQSFFNGIKAQRFNRDGQRVGNEWRVNREDTAEHINPYVAMTNDTMFAIVWETCRTDTWYAAVYGEIYDFNAATATPAVDPTLGPAPLYNQFTVQSPAILLSRNSLNPTAAFDSMHPAVSGAYNAGYNLVVAWDECRNNDGTGTVNIDVMAIQYRVDITPTAGVTIPNTLRTAWRVNSATFDPNTRTIWPLFQNNNQAASDADGDLTVVYAGYGPDVYEATTATTALLGAANDVLFSQFDSATYTPETNYTGYTTVLGSDSVANAYRDGQNEIYRLTLDGRTTGGTFVLTLTSNDLNGPTGNENVTVAVVTSNVDTVAPVDTSTVILNRSATITAINTALEAATRTGRYWSSPYNSSILVTETDIVVSNDAHIINVYSSTPSIKGRFTLRLDTVRDQRVTSYINFDYEDLDDPTPPATNTTARTQERMEAAILNVLVGLGYSDATVTVDQLTSTTTPAFPYLNTTAPAPLGSPPLQYQFLVSFGGAGDTGLAGKECVRHIYQDTVPSTFSMDASEISAASLSTEQQVLSFYGSSSMEGDVQLRVGNTSEVQTISLASETEKIQFRARPESGAFRLAFYDQLTGGQVYTRWIDYDASAQEVENALNAISSIASYGGLVDVTKEETGGIPTYYVTFQGDLCDGDQPLNVYDGDALPAFTFDTSLLTPSSVVIGGTAQPVIVVSEATTTTVPTQLMKGTGRNEVQRFYVTPPADPETATFTLTFDPDGTPGTASQTTGPLAYGATALQVQNALNGLWNIYGYYPNGSVIVRRGGAGTTADQYYYDVVFVKGAGFRPISNAALPGGRAGFIVAAFSWGGVTVATPGTPGQVAGATAGFWTASFNGETTPPLASNVTAQQLETALNALSTIGGVGGLATVTPGQTAHSYVVHFGGSLASSDQNAIVALSYTPSPLNPNYAPSVVETTMGSPTAWVHFDSADLNVTAQAIQTALEHMGYTGATVVRRTVPDTWPSPTPAYQFLVSFGGDLAGTNVPAIQQANDVIQNIDASQVTNWAPEVQTLRVDGLGNKPFGLYKLRILNPDQENHRGEYLTTPNLLFNYEALPDTANSIASALNDLLGKTGITVDALPANLTQTYYDFTISFLADAAAIDYGAVEVAESPHPFSFTVETTQVSTSEIQYLNFYGAPASGFTLKVGDYVTGGITFSSTDLVATAASIQTRLAALGFTGVVVTAQSPLEPFPAAGRPTYQFKVEFAGASTGKNLPDIKSDDLTTAQFTTSPAASKTQLLNFYGDLDTDFTFKINGVDVAYVHGDATTTAQNIATALGGGATVTHGTDPADYPYSYVDETDADVSVPDDQFRIVFTSSVNLATLTYAADGMHLTAIRVAAKDPTSGPRDGLPEVQEIQFYSPTPELAKGYFTFICGQQQIYTSTMFDIESSEVYFDSSDPLHTAWNIETALANLVGFDGADFGYDGVDVQYMASTLSTPPVGSAGRYRVTFGGASASKNVPDITQAKVPVTFTYTSTEKSKGQEEVQHLNFYGSGTMTGTFTLLADGKETGPIYFDASNLNAMAEQIEDELGKISGSNVQTVDFGSETDEIHFNQTPMDGTWAITFTYDWDGDLVVDNGEASTATFTYAANRYQIQDILNGLAAIRGPSSTNPGQVFVSNALDANGNVVANDYLITFGGALANRDISQFTTPDPIAPKVVQMFSIDRSHLYTIVNDTYSLVTISGDQGQNNPTRIVRGSTATMTGNWNLTFRGESTTTFTGVATADAVAAALNLLPSVIAAGGVTVKTSLTDPVTITDPDTYVITFIRQGDPGGTITVSRAALSITSMTRSGTTATVTATGHGYVTGQTVYISGAVQPEYNGNHVIAVTGANTFTFSVAATPASPATGTITAKPVLAYAISDYSGVTVERQSVTTPPTSPVPTYQFKVTYESDTVASRDDVSLIQPAQLPVALADTTAVQGATVNEVQYLNLYGPVSGSFTLIVGGAETDWIYFQGGAATANNIRAALEKLGNFAYNGVEVAWQAVTTTSRLTPEYQFRITFGGRMAGLDVPTVEEGATPTAFSVDSNWYTQGRTDAQYDIMFIGEAHDRQYTLAMGANSLVGMQIEEEAIITINSSEEGYFALGFAGVGGKSPDIFFDPRDPWRVAAAIQAGLRGLLSSNANFDRLYVQYIEGSTYRFRVTFGGTLAGINQPDVQVRTPDHVFDRTNPSDDPNLTSIYIQSNTPIGTNSPLTTTLVETQQGMRGKSQTTPSIGMEPDGDFTLAWSQYSNDLVNQTGGTTEALYVRRFDESTDTTGPLVSDILAPSGDRVSNNDQLGDSPAYIIVTFNEAMMTDPSKDGCVTKLSNWSLLLDGAELNGGIYHVEYGMNRARDLGLRSVGSNKYEAVLYLDGDATTYGRQSLNDGSYQIVALSTLRDAVGNPLGRTGWQINGISWTRSFTVFNSTGGEVLVNSSYPNGTDYTQGNQPLTGSTSPQSPRQVAYDGSGNYVIVWTSDDPTNRGVFAKIYTVAADGYAAGVTIPVTSSADFEYAYPSVACDEDGDFVVTWSVRDPDGAVTDNWDIYYRRYDSDGHALMSRPLPVNSEREDIQKYSSVAMDVQGDFVITWQSLNQDDEGGYGIYAQRYGAEGQTVGGSDEVQLISFTGSPLGAFTISWNGKGPSAAINFTGDTRKVADDVAIAMASLGADVEVSYQSDTEVMVRFVDDSGGQDWPTIQISSAPAQGHIGVTTQQDGSTGEFLVNDTTANNQTWPDISMADDGSFVITWTSAGQTGDAAYQTNVYAKRFGSNAIYSTSRTAESYSLTTLSPDSEERVITTDSPNNHVVNAPSGYDGVVQISRSGGSMLGSGALLTTKMHILTAAHLFCDSTGRQIVNTVDVAFNTASGVVTYTSSQIFIHPGYTGDGTLGGDLAIVVLPSAAPTNVTGYDIYTGTDEIGKTFSLVGYGYGGTGATGEALSAGTKRSGQNRYEMLGSAMTAPFPSATSAVLVYDFDSGQAANDTLGYYYNIINLGLGTAEVNSAHGDSGGPCFINGRIAGVVLGGVTGFVTDAVAGTNSSFGELSYDTRVSSYATWIQQIAMGGGKEILVNTTTANNQKWSSVAMDADGDFVVTWTSYNQDGVGSSYGAGNNGVNGVFAQRYDKNGVKVRNEFLVNTFADNNQQWSRVSMDSDGDFVITWESFQDRPQAPYSDPGVDGDEPNSYGIYAQRFAANAKLSDAFLGANGQIGGELSVNTTKKGDQRYPSVASDDNGDFVIVWSGYGNQDNQTDAQGVFYQRYDQLTDSAAPVVASVYNTTWTGYGSLDPLPQQVLQYSVIQVTLDSDSDDGSNANGVFQFVVTFSESLSEEDGQDGLNSVLNPNNWELNWNDRHLIAAITKVEALAGSKVAYRISFDADSTTAGAQGLDIGTYQLVISPNIEDIEGNALDGNYDGKAGGEFSRTFSIVAEGGAIENPPGEPDSSLYDTPVNANLAGNQNDVAIAYGPSGYYVMVWVTYGQNNDSTSQGNIMAQKYDSDGTKVGDEFVVNDYMLGNQSQPDVAMEYGTFIVTWAGAGVDDDQGIWARRFDFFGTVNDGAEDTQFRVNTYYYSIQQAPAIAIDSDGKSVITWTSYGNDGDRDGVYGQRFDETGQTQGSEFSVNTTTGGWQNGSDVAMDGNGNFTVVWQSDSQDEYGWGIYSRRFNEYGTALSGEVRVNQYGQNNQMAPQIAMDLDGDAIIAWSSWGQDGSNYGVYARRYSPAGAPLAGEFRVNQTTFNNQYLPAVDMSDDGKYEVITWAALGQDYAWSIDEGIYCRIYQNDGDYIDTTTNTAMGEFRINATVVGNQTSPAVACGEQDAGPNFVAVWVGSDGSGTGIFGRNMGLEASARSSFSNPDAYYATTDATEALILSQLSTTTPGLYDPTSSVFYLRDSNDTGMATYTFGYGEPSAKWTPVMGDWDGDGSETIGFYDPATSLFYLRNSNDAGYADYTFGYGAPGLGWLPLVGDWDGNGTDTIGLFDPASSVFYLRNSLTTGYAEITFGFGAPGAGWTPLMGDWNGDGIDTLGLYDPSSSCFYLRNTNNTGYADNTFGYGAPSSGWIAVYGDWNRDGKDSIGFYDPASSCFYLRNTNNTGYADNTFGYGAPGAGWLPVVGQWDGPQFLNLDVEASSAALLGQTSGTSNELLTQDALASIVTEAIGRWTDAGLDSQTIDLLSTTKVKVVDLPGTKLGMVKQGTVYLDTDAAGRGWFVDSTPDADEEFADANGTLTAIDPQALDRIDLLSVVAHELGHVAGFDDLDTPLNDVMSRKLATGVRRLTEATDALFGSDDLDR